MKNKARATEDVCLAATGSTCASDHTTQGHEKLPLLISLPYSSAHQFGMQLATLTEAGTPANATVQQIPAPACPCCLYLPLLPIPAPAAYTCPCCLYLPLLPIPAPAAYTCPCCLYLPLLPIPAPAAYTCPCCLYLPLLAPAAYTCPCCLYLPLLPFLPTQRLMAYS